MRKLVELEFPMLPPDRHPALANQPYDFREDIRMFGDGSPQVDAGVNLFDLLPLGCIIISWYPSFFSTERDYCPKFLITHNLLYNFARKTI